MSKKIIKVFNELIETVEKSSVNNEAKITDVKLWTKSWEKEMETACNKGRLLAFRYFLSTIKVQFKAGAYANCFKIIPTIQITYSSKVEAGFAIEFTWGKWGIGWRFYR